MQLRMELVAKTLRKVAIAKIIEDAADWENTVEDADCEATVDDAETEESPNCGAMSINVTSPVDNWAGSQSLSLRTMVS